jgi:hypothetical protein
MAAANRAMWRASEGPERERLSRRSKGKACRARTTESELNEEAGRPSGSYLATAIVPMSGHAEFRMPAFFPECRTVPYIRLAWPTISTRTVLASTGLFTSRKNAMRALRTPSLVFTRT